jgi:hypothetical protein
MDHERGGREMETKVVINKSLGDNGEYILLTMDDWSDTLGIGVESLLKLHDGRHTCTFFYYASDDESFQKSLDFLSKLQDNINVAYRELQIAYIEAKIRISNAEEDSDEAEDVPEPPTEED